MALEEVPEETRMMQEPFQGLAPSAAASAFGRSEAPDEAFLAPLQPAPAWPAPMEEASAEPVSVAVPSSFGAPPVAFTSGGAALSGGGSAVAVPTAVAATADPFAGPPADVWSDFTGSLTMTDAVPAVPAGGVDQPSTAVVPVVIPAVTADAGPTLPRRSLTRLLALNTLAPLALSSVAALGLLTLTLPAVQRQAAQSQAQTLAAAVGAGLGVELSPTPSSPAAHNSVASNWVPNSAPWSPPPAWPSCARNCPAGRPSCAPRTRTWAGRAGNCRPGWGVIRRAAA
ncbi:hypothetical protein ACFP9V_14480 [Deinococcus radiopugnans]|uniref:hypothetical protein n=1 Tax=Deinococcus radiopugnans TaxID=57497 RepID=UPI003606CA41